MLCVIARSLLRLLVNILLFFQHIARNLLYPDDPKINKMITFSSMTPEMEEIAADISMKAVMRYTLEEDIAENVKQVTA